MMLKISNAATFVWLATKTKAKQDFVKSDVTL